MYRLKPGQESITIVDGPFAGRTFRPGIVYDTIPPSEAARFDSLIPESADPEPKRRWKRDEAKTESEV